MEERIAKIEEHIVTINHELGVVMGKMGTVEKLVVGTFLSSTGAFLAVVGKVCYDILTGG